MDEQMMLIKKLSDAFGPSGCEDAVADAVYNEISPYCAEIKRDRIGNLTAFVPGKSHEKKLLISAHTDEAGFMITGITEQGFLKFDAVAIDARTLCGKKVVIGDGTHAVNGVVHSKAIHLMKGSERDNATPIEKMLIDIGAKDKADALRLCQEGDYGTFCPGFELFGSGKFCGKALDDRAGCAVMCRMIEHFGKTGTQPAFDTYFAFTVRYEIWKSGARAAAYSVKPDYALVIDAAGAGDIPGIAGAKRAVSLGGGPAIPFMDRGTVYSEELISFAGRLADENNIKRQNCQCILGGNDAGDIHKVGEGVRTISLCLPCRYPYTPSCVMDISDYNETYRLALAFAERTEEIENA